MVIPGKEALRKQMRRLSDEHAAGAADASRLIQETVLAMREFREARRIGCYSPLRGEAGLEIVVGECRRVGKEVALPAGDGSGGYVFRTWPEGGVMAAGPHGIPEPEGGIDTPAAELDMILVPGVAFDATGGRLGHGGGFYDRLLSRRAGRAPFLAGLAFSWRVVNSVPVDAHDVRVDCVVTEIGVIGGRRPPCTGMEARS